MFLPLPLHPVCVTAEVNVVEEEQNMWRRIKKGTKLKLDAGRRSALLLSTQRVQPYFMAESLITSTIKNALSRAPREASPTTRVRVRPRDQPGPDAGRTWYEHSQIVLEAAGFVESRLEQGLYYLHGPSGLEAFAHRHVDDFLVAFKKASKKYKDALQHLCTNYI